MIRTIIQRRKTPEGGELFRSALRLGFGLLLAGALLGEVGRYSLARGLL